MNLPKPLVLVPVCNRQVGAHPHHIVGKKYIDAVLLAGAMPILVPAATPEDFDALLGVVDGVLLTGSPSNVHPSHFSEEVHNPALPLDPERDGWTLPLIPRVLELGIPLLGICRGTQEVNVALGGSLYQAVHEVEGHLNHREPEGEPVEIQYGPAHTVQLTPGGQLEAILSSASIEVNSLHGQAVRRLAQGLRVEATAPDGVIEAFSMPAAPGFNLCVQWHPEWQAAGNPVSMKILEAFGKACRDHQHHRLAAATPNQA